MGKTEMICDCDIIHKDIVDSVRNKLIDEDVLLSMADFYKILSDSTRIKIINVLYEAELCVCDISVLLNMTKSAISHQLRNLREMNLVRARKQGKEVYLDNSAFELGESVSADILQNCVDDLEGAKIGVQLGTTGDIYVSDYENDGSGTKVERYNKGADAVQALKVGKIDCVVIDEQPALAFVKENKGLKILDEEFTNVPAIMSTDSDAYRKYNKHWSTSSSYEVPTIANTYWEMYNYSDIRVVNANYLKCTNFSFTYMFPYDLISKWGLERLDLSFSAGNPFTITSSGLKGQTPIQGGFTDIQLSERPTFSFGINVAF